MKCEMRNENTQIEKREMRTNKVACILVTLMATVLYRNSCLGVTYPVCAEQSMIGTVEKLAKLPKISIPLCSQNNCTGNCSCEFGNCTQTCVSTFVCPSVSCIANDTCLQTAVNSTSVSNLFCDAGLKCSQNLMNSAANKMTAVASRVSQVWFLCPIHIAS